MSPSTPRPCQAGWSPAIRPTKPGHRTPPAASLVKTGVREATPGENRSIKGETFEYCYILSGVVELTEEGREPRIFRAGDSFVMKPGYVGVWKTIETVRKIYVVVS